MKLYDLGWKTAMLANVMFKRTKLQLPVSPRPLVERLEQG